MVCTPDADFHLKKHQKTFGSPLGSLSTRHTHWLQKGKANGKGGRERIGGGEGIGEEQGKGGGRKEKEGEHSG